jgi:diguanylate cyclase
MTLQKGVVPGWHRRWQPLWQLQWQLAWRISRWLLAGLCALLWAGAARAEMPAPLQWLPNLQTVDLAPHMAVLEDAKGRWTLQQVRSPDRHWLGTDALVPGFSASTWWLRVAVRNPGTQTLRLVLSLHQPLQDGVHWMVLDERGAVLQDEASGDRMPFEARSVKDRDLALMLTLPPGAVQQVYVRLDSHDGLFEPIHPTLCTTEAFRRVSSQETLLNGLYFGGLLSLMLYHLLLWGSTRQRSFGWFAVYALCLLCWAFTYRGFAFEWLWPQSPRWGNTVLALFATGSLISSSMFFITYLRLAERVPRWQLRGLWTLMGLTALTLPLAAADCYAASWAWCVHCGLLITVCQVGIGLDQMRHGSREAGFHTVSFLPMAFGVSVALLQIDGLVAQDRWTNGLLQVSSALQMVLLALGLADTLKQLLEQKLLAERQARAAQHQLAIGLEHQVKQRTAQLEAANQRLAELSITDALTGAYNRRHFDTRCRDLLRTRGRAAAPGAAHASAAAPLALCMLDIDHFKAYNDRYGHHAGDRALSAVATCLRERLRRDGDQLFRLGGEEFGVLFTAAHTDQALEFAEGLRLAVRGLALPHEGSSLGRVTASFGLVFCEAAALEGMTPEALYSQADGMLYLAKQAGRDRVVSAPVVAGQWAEVSDPL